MADTLRNDGITATALLAQGVAGEAIVAEAARLEADTIVIGSHGHGAVHHLLAGSVSEYVLRHSKRPVLVVPGREVTGG
jgi:nucleotide-binding universal stress UspA family protein